MVSAEKSQRKSDFADGNVIPLRNSSFYFSTALSSQSYLLVAEPRRFFEDFSSPVL